MATNHHDPYDLWGVKSIGRLKLEAQRGNLLAWPFVVGVALADCVAPDLLRRALSVPVRSYAHTQALLSIVSSDPTTGARFLKLAKAQLIRTPSGGGWGYSFDWYTRNAPGGVYRALEYPFVTVTPYVMEGALHFRSDPQLRPDCDAVFAETWGFLEDLKVLQDDETGLCLSYAPVLEPLRIVNANSYAAFAYSMHAVHGDQRHKSRARERAHRLVQWVLAQQRPDGSFQYIADDAEVNFIDAFHSCIVVRNLRRVGGLLPELESVVRGPVGLGFDYIRGAFFDERHGLCRRFAGRARKDPFYRWDIYDQAEFLGLLVDFQELDAAEALERRIEAVFATEAGYACRITVHGKRWGIGYMRWGVAPYLYHRHRLRGLGRGAETCVDS